MIELRLLGPVDLCSPDGIAAAHVLSQPKRLALLAYLAAARPRGFHRRDTLLALFWPELDQAHARAALRNTLHFLRRKLGEGVIVRRGDDVALDTRALWCDAAEFDVAFDTNAPERAIGLYRGHLLEGLHVANTPEFERWLDGESGRLRRRARDAAFALAQTQEQAGNAVLAARWMRMGLDVYPDDEACLQGLLRLLDTIGDRAGALREYERFARQFAAEYDAQPSPETLTLIEEIRSRAEAGPWNGRRAADRPRMSIVVLPFENLSSESQSEHFSDGLMEELIVGLSTIPGLRVIARSSSARLKGTTKDIRAIGRDLSVQYAIEGSVRRDGESLRVAARLIDTATCSVMWSETYAGILADVFEIQERLARAIATRLELRFTENEVEASRSRHQGSIHAYDCYHRAVENLGSYTEEGLDRAVRQVNNGLALVGENALLLATKAYAYLHYVELGIRPEPRYLDQAEEYARQALRINPDLSLGHTALGMVKYKRGDIERAVVDLKTALETDADHPEALLRLALIYLIGGTEAAAAPLLERLLAVDPLTPVNHCLPGYALFLQGEVEGAIPAYRRMHEMDPGSPVTRWFLSLVLSRCGRQQEALILLDEILRDTPDTSFARHALFLKHALQGNRSAALGAATQRLLNEARWDQHASWWMAATYGLLGERDEALDWLANATRLGYINYPFLSRLDPFLDSLRADARFWRLMAQVKDRWERFVTSI